MIRCEEVQNRMADFSVGILDRRQTEAVRAHLCKCPACARELKVMEGTVSLVESAEMVEPPAGLWNAVYNRITEVERKPSLSEQIRSLIAPPRRVFAAGAAALALLAMFSFGRIHPTAAPDRVPDASVAEYVQGHVLFASQDAFADRVGLASVAGAAVPREGANVQ